MLRAAICRQLLLAGFDSVSRQTLDVLTDVAQRFILHLAMSTSSHAQFAGRTEAVAIDVAAALARYPQVMASLLADRRET